MLRKLEVLLRESSNTIILYMGVATKKKRLPSLSSSSVSLLLAMLLRRSISTAFLVARFQGFDCSLCSSASSPFLELQIKKYYGKIEQKHLNKRFSRVTSFSATSSFSSFSPFSPSPRHFLLLKQVGKLYDFVLVERHTHI